MTVEIREAESACVCVGRVRVRVRVRVCLSGKREGEISARKLTLNKYKIFSVIFTASDVSTIPTYNLLAWLRRNSGKQNVNG